MDYEGMIGDTTTRFKYRQVSKNNFGLSAEEILQATDKELNMYVGLRKLAPYRERYVLKKKHLFTCADVLPFRSCM